jgi:Apea-like HEPN
MLSFVQAAVVLEILLGDKAASDLIGLGELLRNRCAYLISRSQAERDWVLQEFRKIYDVRSKIVHAGKRRLGTEEQILFFGLRRICQSVIQEEAKLLFGKRR